MNTITLEPIKSQEVGQIDLFDFVKKINDFVRASIAPFYEDKEMEYAVKRGIEKGLISESITKEEAKAWYLKNIYGHEE